MCQVSDVPFRDIGNAAGRFLALFKSYEPLNYREKQTVISDLVGIMERRLDEAHPDDIGRLVWL